MANQESFSNKSTLTKLKMLPNRQITNYILNERIGEGSYAKVYKAIHKATCETVAVKVFKKCRMTQEQIEKVYFEVDVQKKLFHSNIARIYEFQETDDKIYVFMEHCQNGELFNYINKNGCLSEKFAAKIFGEILSAVKYLKSQRLFHRDIKCQNILFDSNWNAKLVDFGFVTKEQDGCFSRTFCGSPSYTAPEIAQKMRYHSEFVDVWCLGVTLYAMLAGCLPFDSRSSSSTRKNIIEINYHLKRSFSTEVKELFGLIFTQESERASIEDLLSSSFCEKYQGIQSKANFMNPNLDEIGIDSNILEALEKQFNLNSYDVIDSVTQFKADSLSAYYYLMVQKEISKGHKIKSDISSSDYQKTKKRSETLKLLKISMRPQSLQKSRKLIFNDKNFDPMMPTPEIKGRKDTFRVRPSVDISKARLRARDQSPQSPKRILDLVSAYRRY